MNKKQLSDLVKKSTSFRDVGRKADISNQSAKRWVCKLGIDYSHFRHGKAYDEMVGKKINMLTIIKIKKIHQNKNLIARTIATCLCECGQTKMIRASALRDGRYVSCGCHARNRWNMVGELNPAFKGCGAIGKVYFEQLKRNAMRRNLKFTVSLKFLWRLFQRQKKKCVLTNVPLAFGRARNSHETNASLDRIDNSKGYVHGNLRWILKDINLLRRDYDTEYFIKLCNLIANFHPRKVTRSWSTTKKTGRISIRQKAIACRFIP